MIKNWQCLWASKEWGPSKCPTTKEIYKQVLTEYRQNHTTYQHFEFLRYLKIRLTPHYEEWKDWVTLNRPATESTRKGKLEAKVNPLLSANPGANLVTFPTQSGLGEALNRLCLDEFCLDDTIVERVKHWELTEGGQLYPQPLTISVPLFNHQKAAILQMIRMEKKCLDYTLGEPLKSNLGILADKPGAGKSFTVLGLLESEHEIEGSWSTKMTALHSVPPKHYDCNVIVVPDNIVTQWSEYLSKTSYRVKLLDNWSPQKTDTYRQLKNITWGQRYDREHQARYQLPNEIEGVEDGDLLLVPETYLGLLFWHNLSVKRVIIDEVDSMECRFDQTWINLHCQFMWFVTATPMRILEHQTKAPISIMDGSVGEQAQGLYRRKQLFPYFLFHRFKVTQLDQIVVKNTDNYINQSIQLPPVNLQTLVCRQPVLLKVLHGINLNEIEESLNACDLQTVSNILKCPITQPSDVISKITADLNLAIEKLEWSLETVASMDQETYNLIYTVPQNEKIEEIKRKISSNRTKSQAIKERLEGLKGEVCGICYEDLDAQNYQDPPVLLECCHHIMCTRCLSQLRATTDKCSFCRHKKLVFTILSDYNKKSEEPDLHANQDPLGKAETVAKIINEKPGGKFLVFSNKDGTFRDLQQSLGSIQYRIIDQNAQNVHETVESFRNGSVNVLLMNAIKHGAGLNLQSATDIIICHSVDRATREQIIGRGQRIGRTDQLTVHTLLYENEKF